LPDAPTSSRISGTTAHSVGDSGGVCTKSVTMPSGRRQARRRRHSHALVVFRVLPVDGCGGAVAAAVDCAWRRHCLIRRQRHDSRPHSCPKTALLVTLARGRGGCVARCSQAVVTTSEPLQSARALAKAWRHCCDTLSAAENVGGGETFMRGLPSPAADDPQSLARPTTRLFCFICLSAPELVLSPRASFVAALL